MDVATTFGEWLRARRKEFGYTQEELADMVGCSPATIRKIESGDRRPSRQMAELLAEYLEVPQEDRAAFIRMARSEPGGPVTALRPGTFGNGHAPHAEPEHETPASNLPIGLTPLIGREDTVDDLCDRLLRDEVRLLTLTGPPGIGKTRLAVEVASQLADHFPDGVFFVGLSTVTDPDLVPAAIAQVVGVREGGSQSVTAALVEHMRDRRMLLLLDNFEQVVSAATAVGALLAACPTVKAMVTSREALNIRGERQFPVPPLHLPNTASLPPLDALAEYPAVQLFVERAASVQPTFALTEDNARAVATLCARLDGLPLAIELVAARVRLLGPAQLLARLDHRLALVTGGQRDLPERQQTLRNAIGWSYDLLTHEEQALFARLGVFVGGWAAAAAEAVCNPRGDLEIDVLGGIESLLNKSLVQISSRPDDGDGPEARFTMLETIREYALEQLEARDEADDTHQMHAEYYLALAGAAEPHLMGAEAEEWLGMLESDHDNFRAALRWALDEGEHEIALGIAGALGRFWSLYGYLTEGRRWLDEVMSRRSAAATRDRARVFQWAAALARKQDSYEEARDLYGNSLILYRELEDLAGTGEVLEHLAMLNILKGNYDTGIRLAEEAIEMGRKLGDRYRLTRALYMLAGAAIYSGDLARGESVAREGLAVAREMDNSELISYCINALGVALHWQGKHEEAGRLYDEALQRARVVNDPVNIAQILANQAELALHVGDCEESAELFRQSLRYFVELGGTLGISEGVMGLAMGASCRGDGELSAVLHGAAEAMRRQIGTPIPPFVRPLRGSYLQQAKSLLTEAEWQAAWDRGAAMPPEEVVALALGEEIAARA
ncbi:MAG TPA: helix-turn-helix domain-containing protein [Chloroflexia bacterium]|nr:helix-turn-helix domain-containing protein [Chloroflexia bacterium]